MGLPVLSSLIYCAIDPLLQNTGTNLHNTMRINASEVPY